MDLDKPSGTRDFLPKEMRLRSSILKTIREKIESMGYQEVQTPTFEFLNLFEIRSGEKFRDDVFVFQDPTKYLKDEDKVVDYVLRPEFTAPICRLYVTSDLCVQPKPVKIYYVGSCYRYETPQPGRYREFTQVGVELIGSSHPEADVELILVAVEALEALGLDDLLVRINDLNILRGLLSDFNYDFDFQNRIFNVIDGASSDLRKLELGVPINKVRDEVLEEVREELSELNLATDLISILMMFLDLQGDLNVILPEIKTQIKKYPNAIKALEESPLEFVIKRLKTQDMTKYKIDLGIARGLDYYTNIVFEIDLPILGNQKQVCGGGRYNRLIQEFGGEDTPATGFAFGFDRLVLAWQKIHQESETNNNVDVMIVPYSLAEQDWAFKISKQLRLKGFKVEIDLMRRKFRKSLDHANKKQIPFTIIIGPDEVQKCQLSVKNMKTGEQKQLSLNETVLELKKNQMK
ncbi:MAG: histidine--tRNA ligase [Candidatus Helarchaeota archaeon]